MKKNELTELTIEDMSDEGLGIGHAGGMAVFVKDAVPGDKVIARIVKEKKTYAFARVEDIIEPGAHRVQAPCPVARSCGGCQIQELDMPAQLALKEKKVRNNLERIGGFRIEGNRICSPDAAGAVEKERDVSGGGDEASTAEREQGMAGYGILYPVRGMKDPWGYRNKAQFPIGRGRDGQPTAGFYAGRTHTIIDNHRCLIGIDENRYILEAVLDWMNQYHVSAYDEKKGSGLIRHVMTRAGFATGQLMVVIVAASERLPHEDALIRSVQDAVPARQEKNGGGHSEELQADRDRCYELAGIVLNFNPDKTNVILGKTDRILFGRSFIEDRIGDLTFRISAKSFYQVNPVQTHILYETALDYAELTGSEDVWDLYCGIGTISLSLARRAGHVTGVEVVPEAVRNAEENAKLNHIDNCRFIAGKAEDIVRSLGKADVIVTDPPRKGLDRTVIDAIISASPERIVYVSCDSATLARDLKLLSAGGYAVRKVQPVDMFPQTVHVECVVLLARV